jgi:hypothetical protein
MGINRKHMRSGKVRPAAGAVGGAAMPATAVGFLLGAWLDA